jgi:hypothetical protein
MNISLFKTAMDTIPERNINFYSFLSFIKDGKWEDYAHEVRNGKRDKKTMPAVTPSGVFTKRNAASIDQHSGIISIDIDIKDNEAADIEGLEQDPYTWAVHHSIGGYGWVAYFKIEPEKHLQAYYGLEKYLADNYKIIADKACKDVSRLRYVSYDPDLYQSENEPKAFKLYVKDITKELELTDVVAFDSDYQYIVEQIREKRIDLTAGGYHDWLQIGFSLANGLGEKGRDIYHVVSEQNLNYNKKETDRKYDECLKSDVGLTRLNTFFYFCSKAKIKTQSETTKTIFSVVQAAKSRDSQSPAQQKESAYKLLQKEGYEGSEVVLTVEKGFEIDIKSKKKFKSSGTDTDQIIEILADHKIRFNLVTRAMEIDGKNLTDREFNDVYVDINLRTGKTMGSQLVSSVIDSSYTPSYNPFTEYLAQAELKTMKFSDVKEKLKKQFSGANAAYL